MLKQWVLHWHSVQSFTPVGVHVYAEFNNRDRFLTLYNYHRPKKTLPVRFPRDETFVFFLAWSWRPLPPFTWSLGANTPVYPGPCIHTRGQNLEVVFATQHSIYHISRWTTRWTKINVRAFILAGLKYLFLLFQSINLKKIVISLSYNVLTLQIMSYNCKL